MRVEWVSVKERLPENGEQVLCYRRKRGWMHHATYWREANDLGGVDLWMSDEGGFIRDITHWTPLPERPG